MPPLDYKCLQGQGEQLVWLAENPRALSRFGVVPIAGVRVPRPLPKESWRHVDLETSGTAPQHAVRWHTQHTTEDAQKNEGNATPTPNPRHLAGFQQQTPQAVGQKASRDRPQSRRSKRNFWAASRKLWRLLAFKEERCSPSAFRPRNRRWRLKARTFKNHSPENRHPTIPTSHDQN